MFKCMVFPLKLIEGVVSKLRELCPPSHVCITPISKYIGLNETPLMYKKTNFGTKYFFRVVAYLT